VTIIRWKFGICLIFCSLKMLPVLYTSLNLEFFTLFNFLCTPLNCHRNAFHTKSSWPLWKWQSPLYVGLINGWIASVWLLSLRNAFPYCFDLEIRSNFQRTTTILTVAFENSVELAGEIKLIELFWPWQLISWGTDPKKYPAKTHDTRTGLAKWKIIIQVAPLGCSLALWIETPTHPRTQCEFHANLFDFLACPCWKCCY